MTEPRPLQPEGAAAILAALEAARVRYVVIGMSAAWIHARVVGEEGLYDQLQTRDLDVAVEREAENLDRLAKALRELGASQRVERPSGVEEVAIPTAALDGRLLAQQQVVWNLTTPHGDLDLNFETTAFPDSYAEFSKRARRMRFENRPIEVADLSDVIRSKEIADRPRDREALPRLRQIAERLRTIERELGRRGREP